MHPARHPLILLLALAAGWIGPEPALAGDRALGRAEAAFAKVDYSSVVALLLPLYERGALQDSRGLFILARSCSRRDSCRARSGRILREAADAGDVQAMINLAAGPDARSPSLRTAGGEIDRATAYRYALAARALASDGPQRQQAEEVLDRVGRPLTAAERSGLTPYPVAIPPVRQAPQATAPAVAGAVVPGWVDEAAQRRPQRYVPGAEDQGGGPDMAQAESDADVPDRIDPRSIIRRGERVQYVLSGMDTVVLIQARCSGGAPDLVWEADPQDAEEDGTLVFLPGARQPVPQEQRWIEYYAALTRQACSH